MGVWRVVARGRRKTYVFRMGAAPARRILTSRCAKNQSFSHTPTWRERMAISSAGPPLLHRKRGRAFQIEPAQTAPGQTRPVASPGACPRGENVCFGRFSN
jgi:hypothetical protein